MKLRLIGGDVEGKVKGDHLEGVRAKQKGTTRSKEIRYTDKNKLSVIGGRRWSSWKSHEEKGFNQGIGKDGLYIDPSLSLSSIEDFLPANLKKHHQNQTSEGIHVFSPKVLNSLITALEKDAISLALRVSGFADDDISSWPQESESERDISRDKRAFGRSPERFIPCGWGGCYS